MSPPLRTRLRRRSPSATRTCATIRVFARSAPYAIVGCCASCRRIEVGSCCRRLCEWRAGLYSSAPCRAPLAATGVQGTQRLPLVLPRHDCSPYYLPSPYRRRLLPSLLRVARQTVFERASLPSPPGCDRRSCTYLKRSRHSGWAAR